MPHFQPRCAPPRRLVHPVGIDPAGVQGPTRGQAYGPRWRRTGPAQFVPVDAPACVEQRILEEWSRVPGAVVTGWAACRLYGASYFDGLALDGRTELPVPLAIAPDRSARPWGARVVRQAVAPEHRARVRGIQVVVPGRAVVEAARLEDCDRESVVAIDMALASGIVLPEWLEEAMETAPQRGLGRVRRAVGRSSVRSCSPYESRLRLVMTEDLGWPTPLQNREIYDLAGRFLARPDLFDPTRGLAVEYDGSAHRTRERHRRDVDRTLLLRGVGIEVVPVTGGGLTDARSRARVAHVLATAAAVQKGMSRPRAWTTDPPRGAARWVPAVDELRSHLEGEAEDFGLRPSGRKSRGS